MQQVAYKAWTSVYQERTSAFALTDGCLGSLSQVMVTRGSYASTLNTNNYVYPTRRDATRLGSLFRSCATKRVYAEVPAYVGASDRLKRRRLLNRATATSFRLEDNLGNSTGREEGRDTSRDESTRKFGKVMPRYAKVSYDT